MRSYRREIDPCSDAYVVPRESFEALCLSATDMCGRYTQRLGADRPSLRADGWPRPTGGLPTALQHRSEPDGTSDAHEGRQARTGHAAMGLDPIVGQRP